MRILIVEDELRLADALAQILSEQKYMVDVVYDGVDGLAYAESGIYDVVILDVMLPKLDGFQVVAELRRKKVAVPVLMLTARETVADKIHGLDAGADDYMTKPFDAGELLARVRVLSRRKGEVITNEIAFADIVFDMSSMLISCAESGKSVRLSFKEAEMLKLFLSNPKAVFSKEELITKLWGFDSDAGDNNVEAYVSFLRKKLNFVGSKCEISTLKKVGYRLEAENA